MSDIQPEPQVTPPAGDSQAIRDLRAALDDHKRKLAEVSDRNKTLEKQITDAERAKLEDIERLKLELSDALQENERVKSSLEGGASRLERFEKTFSGLYESELATVPEEHREKVAALSSAGEWDDRLTALRTAVSLLPTEQDRKHFGTTNSPGDVRDPEKAKVLDMKNLPGWGEILSKPA